MHSNSFSAAGCSSSAGFSSARRLIIPIALFWLVGLHAVSTAAQSTAQPLALTPPMGWNDWAHYQCGFNAQTILDNATALVKTGLAARGYNTVTIDDCWMLKTRDAQGNLQPDPERFPHGMKPMADAIHHLGLKFGIYEDAGSTTCGEFAGSGWPKGSGPKDEQGHFLQDARLFASWGVDYLKLDGCNLYVRDPHDNLAAYRKAYAAEQAALRSVGRPIVFSESAPAYFEFSPEWYDVLTWVRGYGQLWREADDMANYDAKTPDTPRFKSVLFNYAYNLPLGRFQKPGNWNDADFIIGGDSGMNLAETRSQLALWSMMSAPLILSSDVGKLSPEAVAILGNRKVIAIDQDPLGRVATLVQRTATTDLLLKPLKGGDYAVAVLNRGDSPLQIHAEAEEFGLDACYFGVEDLWTGESKASILSIEATIAPHDTGIWRVHQPCHKTAYRTGVIVMTTDKPHDSIDGYARCLTDLLASPPLLTVEDCSGDSVQKWGISPLGEVFLGNGFLSVYDGKPAVLGFIGSPDQRWRYTLAGNLINKSNGLCLTNQTASTTGQPLTLEKCGHNQLNQIWSLPN
jgi:alpha-galactosidase